jgi:uncharacterized protein YcgI (DUF1989 family)
VILPARRGRAFRLSEGECIRVVNIHGSQVVDAWALAPPAALAELGLERTACPSPLNLFMHVSSEGDVGVEVQSTQSTGGD